MIPPDQNRNFVACMEKVLEIYKRPYDPMFPVVCMDESPKQLISETKTPIPAAPGQTSKMIMNTNNVGYAIFSWPMSYWLENDLSKPQNVRLRLIGHNFLKT